jgi:RNA-directed DNA polymerase
LRKDRLKGVCPQAAALRGGSFEPQAIRRTFIPKPGSHEQRPLGIPTVRYADDFVILCRSQSEAEQALMQVRQWCEAEGLVLHPIKTQIVNVRQVGFDFLGYHFQTTRQNRLTRWPRKKSLDKLKAAIRAKTGRKAGRALLCIIADLNRTLRGWFEYFKHSYHTTFSFLDGWIRGRLRSILRKRAGGKGRGRGLDHHRWPNAFFARHGYFSLTVAHARVRQSPCG